MTCDYDKSWQRLNDLWQNAKAKNSKEPARVIWPLAKVKAIRTDESFLLQVPTKHLLLFINSVNSPSTIKNIRTMTHPSLCKGIYFDKRRQVLWQTKGICFWRTNKIAIMKSTHSSFI